MALRNILSYIALYSIIYSTFQYMYPNVPHEQVQKQFEDIQKLVLANIILKKNYFEKKELECHQKKVLLLGPSSLLQILTFLWQGYKREFSETVFLCSQYLDEIFCIETLGSQKLNGLFNCMNSMHPAIKFTIDSFKTIDKLETDLYCKPHDTHQYLHAQLCHRNVY